MKVKAVVFSSSSSETHQSKFFKRLINILLQEDSGILFFLSFWVKMKNWKLLGELSAEEVKLECERANLVVKQNSSQNLVRLSKYIMTTGYDPETFFFNTLYQGIKNVSLVGMAVSSSSAQGSSSTSNLKAIRSKEQIKIGDGYGAFGENGVMKVCEKHFFDPAPASCI